VDVLTTGFNAKCVDAIAILRATMSPGLFCQMVGRGLRLHEGKTSCLLLDFGQNISRHGSIDDENFGRSEGKGRAGVAAENGRGKRCPSCELDVSPATVVCPECNFIFPRDRELKHDITADETSQLTGAIPPEEWEVKDVVVRVHTKRDDEHAPQTVRVDYVCGKTGVAGNLTTILIPEWTCPGHQGFARLKFLAWWDARSICDPPDNATDAVALINMGVCRRPVRITTKKDGRWHRVTECFFESKKPTELAQQEETKVFSGIDDDLPF
jgi:DNA repair protein RadD